MSLKLRRNFREFFLIFIITIGISINFFVKFNFTFQEKINEEYQLLETATDFNILDFWQDEILRVNNTDLNIIFSDNSTIEYTNPYTQQEYEFTSQEIYFNSPNWVGATPENLTLNGFLLYPEVVNSSNPGCLCMHGINDNAESAFKLAYPYLEKGFIVLCHSHPGHGKSEGAEPNPNNMYYQGEYNKSAHFYLTLCGAIQGLRVLENLSIVNNSQIMVTGISYGGLNSMWLAGICGERISGVVTYIALGDIVKNLQYPNKLIFWILGKSPKEIPVSYRNNQLLRFDPIYYLKSKKMPPIMWQIGTNDDFFHYSSIRSTYEAVNHSKKFLQIYPNEHHGFPGFENTTKSFIDFVLYNSSIPPNITIQNVRKIGKLIGETLRVDIQIESTKVVESVKIYYKHTDILGACWQKIELDKQVNNTWSTELNPWIITSRLDFYVAVELEGKEDVWFTSNIYAGGILTSNYTIIFLSLISFLIISILALIIWRRYNKISLMSDKQDQIQAKKYFIKELIFIGITESFFYISIILPWISYESGSVNFTHIYFFNNFFTWKLFIGEISPISTMLFLLGWIIYSYLSLLKPIITGILKIIYPIFILISFNLLIRFTGITSGQSLLSNFGAIIPSFGLFLMIIASIVMLIIGIWKRNYQKRLGIKKKKKYDLKKIFKYIIQRWETWNRD
ncbi:MAG: alpha/beta hydrolase family protein [Candidatus Hodarchaeota archaeon]